MTIDLDDLPIVESAGRLGRRVPPDSAVADAYSSIRPGRENLLTSAGFSLGLQAVDLLRERVLPSARQFRAFGTSATAPALGGAAPNYTMYSDCGPYDYDATCEEACFGFAAHHMDPFYCATCDEQSADPVNNPAWNWHFVGSRGQLQYKDREPDVCAGRDAWKWTVGPCGECRESAVFRCHDGYKKYPNASAWDGTICQGIVACDQRLKLC